MITTTVEVCENYANECMAWAREASDNKRREACLEMARAWEEIAAVLEGKVSIFHVAAVANSSPQT